MDVDINSAPGMSKGSKKRLLFIITQSEMGGAQQFLIHLLPQLDTETYEVRVAIGRDGDGSLIQTLQGLGVLTIALYSLRRDIHPFSDLKAVYEVKSLIKDYAPDTLFLLSSKAGFIGSLAARLSHTSTRVIYRIGGWTFKDPWPVWKKKFWIFLEKISAPWKDIIIVNNNPDLIQAGNLKIIPREGIHMIHNGIDPYKLSLLPKEQARRELLNGSVEDYAKKKIIGTIANFYPAKGLTYLIDAATHLKDPDVLVVIVGDGTERSSLERQIQELHLSDKVILTGHRANASQYLCAFDIFAFSSIKEGFPWAVLEAMSAKLPIVATRVGAVPELIENGVQGRLVTPANGQALADALGTLLQNEGVAQQMGIQAHQKVLFSFTLDAMIQRIKALL